MVLSAYVMLKAKEFPAAVVTSAGAALFVDVLGLLISVWKIALNPGFATKLTPVTQVGRTSGSKGQVDAQVS
jgi:hypothetical protein